ncbi:MAG: hypothetical protein RI932_2010, partial [Pseudomonadota bacterium]
HPLPELKQNRQVLRPLQRARVQPLCVRLLQQPAQQSFAVPNHQLQEAPRQQALAHVLMEAVRFQQVDVPHHVTVLAAHSHAPTEIRTSVANKADITAANPLPAAHVVALVYTPAAQGRQAKATAAAGNPVAQAARVATIAALGQLMEQREEHQEASVDHALRARPAADSVDHVLHLA